MSTPKYLRKMGTKEIFAYTDLLALRKDMMPYFGPVPYVEEEVETPVVVQDTPEDLDERTAAIMESIRDIPRTDYARAAFGRPAMPKIDVVEAKLGYTVTAAEVIRAMKRLEVE